jgi:hypothetical protein
MAAAKIDVSDSIPSEGRAEDLLMIPAPWDVSVQLPLERALHILSEIRGFHRVEKSAGL